MVWNSCSVKHERVVVVLNDDQLLLNWIRYGDGKIILKARKTVYWRRAEVVCGIMYNMPQVSNEIIAFLQAYNLVDNPITLCIDGSSIYEDFLKTENTDNISSVVDKQLTAYVWQACYLCPAAQNNGFWHYVCGMKRETIFSCSLLSAAIKRPINVLTTVTAALLSLYRHRPKVAFRQGDLSADLERCGGSIEQLFPLEILTQYMQLPTGDKSLSTQELRAVGAALGVFLVEAKNNENH